MIKQAQNWIDSLYGAATTLGLLFLCICLSNGAEASDEQSIIRVDEFGYPNLNGIWNFDNNTPFERPTHLGNQEFLDDERVASDAQRVQGSPEKQTQPISKLALGLLANPAAHYGVWGDLSSKFPNRRTSVIIYPKNGRLPKTKPNVQINRTGESTNCNTTGSAPLVRPVRMARGTISCDRPEDFGLSERCLFFPQTTGPYVKANPYNNNIQIVVTKDHVVLNSELGNDPRIIQLSANGFLDERIKTWTGSSRAHWEENTLVVETRNFTEKLASVFLRWESYGRADRMILTERFTLASNETLLYEFTIDDPFTFEDTIKGINHFVKSDLGMYEYSCHEGNYSMTNMLKGGRVSDIRGY